MSAEAATRTDSAHPARGGTWSRLLGGLAALVCAAILIELIARSNLPLLSLVIVAILGIAVSRSFVAGAYLLIAVAPFQSLGLRRLSLSPADAVLVLIILRGMVAIARGSRPRDILAWPSGAFGLAVASFLFFRIATGIIPAARLASDFLASGFGPGILSIAQAIFSGTSNPLGEFWHHAAVVLLLLLLTRRPLLKGSPPGMARIVVPLVALFGIVSIVERAVGARWGYEGLEAVLGLGFTFGRIPGFFSWPTQLATYLDILLPVVLALAVVRRPKAKDTAWASIAAVLGIVALYLTLTRSGWMGLLLSCGAVLVLAIRAGESWRRLAVAAALLAVLIVPLTFGILRAREETGSQAGGRSEAGGRMEYIWPTAIRMIAAHPLFGCGLGTWRTASVAYAPHAISKSRSESVHAHNIFLQAGAESGIPASLALLFLLVVTARGLWRRSRRGDPLWIGLAAALPGYVAHGQFEDILFPPELFLCFWVFMVLAMGRWDAEGDAESDLAPPGGGGISYRGIGASRARSSAG